VTETDGKGQKKRQNCSQTVVRNAVRQKSAL